MRSSYSFGNAVCSALLFTVLAASPAFAQLLGPVPKDLEDVGIVEQAGAQVPLDVSFVDSDGKSVRLSDIINGAKPILLTLNYSNCPMLCSLQLDGLFDALGAMPWGLGDNFQMLTISIDPLETPQRAKLTKQKYLRMYGRAGVEEGWRCLVGKEPDIRRVADAVGFHYKYLPDSREYSHAAAAIVLTPDGRVSRYLYGIVYDPQTIRLSLVEAADGKVGSTLDQLLLFCFHYDATKGRYGPAAAALMRVGALLTVIGVVCMVFVFWRRGSAVSAAAAADESAVAGTGSDDQRTTENVG